MNGVIHKVIQINVPKYVHININAIRALKNEKKELLASRYKQKIEKRYNGMIQKHIKYINEIVALEKDCFCEHDIKEEDIEEVDKFKETLDELKKVIKVEETEELDKLKETLGELKKEIKIIVDDEEVEEI